jgi:hypothetical protein
MSLWEISIIVFILNIPFGYWRANTRRFSWQWILAVHLPVPVVILFRCFSGLGWQFITFPVLIGAFFLGQFLGGKLHKWCTRGWLSHISSCLVWDLVIKLREYFNHSTR